MSAKGVVIEFDFAVVDGATLLYETTKNYLDTIDHIALDEMAEAKYFVGKSYEAGLAAYFPVVKTKKTVVKAARELPVAFETALDSAVASSITQSFRNFVKVLSDKGVRTIIATRANLARNANSFAPLLSDHVVLYHEESKTYGGGTWDTWPRACVACRVSPHGSIAVTGSGLGVKGALRAGFPSIAVTREHVAYQDCSGADEIVRELNAAAAKRILNLLKVA